MTNVPNANFFEYVLFILVAVGGYRLIRHAIELRNRKMNNEVPEKPQSPFNQ